MTTADEHTPEPEKEWVVTRIGDQMTLTARWRTDEGVAVTSVWFLSPDECGRLGSALLEPLSFEEIVDSVRRKR